MFILDWFKKRKRRKQWRKHSPEVRRDFITLNGAVSILPDDELLIGLARLISIRDLTGLTDPADELLLTLMEREYSRRNLSPVPSEGVRTDTGVNQCR